MNVMANDQIHVILRGKHLNLKRKWSKYKQKWSNSQVICWLFCIALVNSSNKNAPNQIDDNAVNSTEKTLQLTINVYGGQYFPQNNIWKGIREISRTLPLNLFESSFYTLVKVCTENISRSRAWRIRIHCNSCELAILASCSTFVNFSLNIPW